MESEASSAHSSGRGDFLAVAADDPISLAAEASRKTKKKKKKKKRKGEDDDDKDDDDDDNSAEKSLSKAAKKAKKKHKKRAEAEATTDLAAAAAVLTPPPPPQPQTPAAAARQLHFPAPVTLASHRIPSGESAPQAAAAASAAAAAPETLLKWRASAARPDVKKGRLSSAEKEALVAAAKGFARSKGLSIEDLSWLFETRTGASRGLSRGAWNAIAAALPQRTAKSVYAAGTRLLHPGNYKGAWTSEEISRLRELVSQRGNRWAEIGGALGRLPEACRDRWKELGGSGSGSNAAAAAPAPAPAPASPFNSKRWAPDEVERLERAVRSDLAMKAAAAAAFASDCGGGGGGGGREEEAPLSPSSASRLPPAGVAASVVGARAVLDGVNWSLVSSRCALPLFIFSSSLKKLLRTGRKKTRLLTFSSPLPKKNEKNQTQRRQDPFPSAVHGEVVLAGKPLDAGPRRLGPWGRQADAALAAAALRSVAKLSPPSSLCRRRRRRQCVDCRLGPRRASGAHGRRDQEALASDAQDREKLTRAGVCAGRRGDREEERAEAPFGLFFFFSFSFGGGVGGGGARRGRRRGAAGERRRSGRSGGSF